MNPKVFLQAARYLHEDPERFEFCPLRAILVDRPGRQKFIEMYLARAFFVYLFRPKRVKPGAHWWPKEIDGPIISLLLAAEVAKEVTSQLGCGPMMEVCEECLKGQQRDFEIGQAALLKRALAAERRPAIDASLHTRLTHELRNL